MEVNIFYPYGRLGTGQYLPTVVELVYMEKLCIVVQIVVDDCEICFVARYPHLLYS